MRYERLIILIFGLLPQGLFGQEVFSLKACIDYAVENNHVLQKSKLDSEKSLQARREVLGALMPQVNGTGAMTYNMQKTTFAMPNFVNSMMPAAMQDPNAPKYMTVEMGMNYTANVGAGLIQQVLNFSLFNALDIAESAQNMATLRTEISTNDIISQTAILFYNIQVLGYAVTQFDESLLLMDKTLATLQINFANDLVRQVDIDRVQVTKTNLETQKLSLQQALSVQKNLLKLQMGFEMNDDIKIQQIDIKEMEALVNPITNNNFDVNNLLPYQLIKKQQQLSFLQQRSATYETLPTLTLGANYAMNFMSDEFFTGDTYHSYPVSMLSLNLRVPIFSGLSKLSKINQAKLERQKVDHDEQQLTQSLTMGYNNATMQLEGNRKTISAQSDNKRLAEEVFRVTESNYTEGLASLSDVLNASSSLIQSQVNYVEALNDYMKAYIDLKNADGTIRELME